VRKCIRQSVYLLCAYLLTLVCLSACSVLAADGRLALAAVARPDDRITWTVTENTLYFDIHSPSGIGHAVIRMMAGQYPQRIILRFHLDGLEELRFAYGTVVVTVSILSMGARAVQQQVALDAGEEMQAIAPDSRYWMKTRLLAEQAPSPTPGALIDGYIEVEPPPAFLRSQQPTFSIAWIDFFR
jgi:hypothetical protein